MSPPTNHVPIKQQQSCRPVSPGGITFFSCCRCWQGLKWCHILHRNREADFQRSIPGNLFTVTLAASLGHRKQQTFEPKVMSRAHEQHCSFLSVTHKSQDLEEVFAYETSISKCLNYLPAECSLSLPELQPLVSG